MNCYKQLPVTYFWYGADVSVNFLPSCFAYCAYQMLTSQIRCLRGGRRQQPLRWISRASMCDWDVVRWGWNVTPASGCLKLAINAYI